MPLFIFNCANEGNTLNKLSIPEDFIDARLDRFLRKTFPSLKQGMIEKWCRKGAIRLSGKKAQPGTRLEKGQEVILPNFEETSVPKVKKSLSKAEIDYAKSLVIDETDEFWVLDKPSSLAVQGGSKTTKHLDRLLPALGDEARIVHRLDKETSGLLLIAKTYKAAQRLTKMFKEHKIQKTYLAVVEGSPLSKRGIIKDPIDRKEAISSYQVLEALPDNHTLLELKPKTGRTHQLRIHCKALGCPILGDKKYGDFKGKGRLMLHAYKLEFEEFQFILEANWNKF